MINYNYIDPGTTGIVVGSVWPAVLAALAAIAGFLTKVFWKPIKRLLKRGKDEAPGSGAA